MQQTNQNPREATLARLLSALARDALCFREEQTEVSYEVRKRVIDRLLALRKEIHALQKLYGGLYPIQLSILDRARSDTLLQAQAFHLDYGNLDILVRLHRQRDLRETLAECLEAGKRAMKAVAEEEAKRK